MKRKGIILLLVLCIFSSLTATATAAETVERTLALTEDWRLTDQLDLDVPENEVLVVDGDNKYYIYEMSAAAVLKNTGAGFVRFKDTQLYHAGAAPQPGSLAELLAAASGVTDIAAPAQGAASLTLPSVSGYSVNIKTSSNTGVIALDGTITPPAGATPVNLVLTLAGNGGMADTSSIAVIVPAATGLSITTASLPAATVGSAYSQTITQSCTSAAAISFSATGLPDGLSINAETGHISGIPAGGTDAGSPYNVEVSVTDGTLADTKTFSLTVNPASVLSITTASLPAATVGSAYSQTIAKNYTGGGTLSFSATGLPGGLSINAGTGRISGTPASGTNAGSPYTVGVSVTDGTLTDTKTFSLTVSPAYSGGGVSFTPTPTYKADIEGGGSISVSIDAGKGGAALDLSSLSNNSLFDGGKIIIDVPSIPGVNTYTANLPAASFSGSGKGLLTLNTSLGSLAIPDNMLTGAGLTGKAGITIGEGDKSNLPDNMKAVIGDRPFIRLTMTVNGVRTDWNNPDAPVTVSIPYTPTAEELAHPESIVVWYIDGSGNVVTVPNGHYDPATGTVTVELTHFSDYAVAYDMVSFNDVPADAWYNKAVSFIAARKITSGTGNANYDPAARLTRGEFIVLMMRAYGIAPDAGGSDNFADAGNAYYTGYLAAAKRLGISAGVGNNMYAPGREITRQDMFALLYNALKVIGQLPQGDSGKTLSDFTDAGQIDSWAKESMTLLVKTGVIGGNAGKLTPLSTTTRAEMAQVLCNLLMK